MPRTSQPNECPGHACSNRHTAFTSRLRHTGRDSNSRDPQQLSIRVAGFIASQYRDRGANQLLDICSQLVTMDLLSGAPLSPRHANATGAFARTCTSHLLVTATESCAPSMPIESPFSATLLAAQQGDAAALDRLFAQFYPLVQKRVHHELATDFRKGRDWMAAMLSTADVVQEVFLKVLQGIKSFQGGTETEFAAYLTALTRNRILDTVRFHTAMRRDRRRTATDSHEATDPNPQGIDPLITREELTRYIRVLASFDERERLLLRSRIEGGGEPPSFAQLATELGFPSVGAARQAYFRARARLAVLLGNHKDT